MALEPSAPQGRHRYESLARHQTSIASVRRPTHSLPAVLHSPSSNLGEAHQAICGDSLDSDDEFREGLLRLTSRLRSYSHSHCRDRELADDFVQDALCNAWASRSFFQRGSNLKAWLYTILRNVIYSHIRRAWRQQPWDEAAALRIPGAENQQDWSAQLSDAVRALHALPSKQREALILSGVGGFGYADIARICSCPEGTAKSRVARARRTILAAVETLRLRLVEARPPAGCASYEIVTELDRLTAKRGALRLTHSMSRKCS